MMKISTLLTHKCPACNGDGKETCNNPDHGFISAMAGVGNGDIQRLGCPCCGHNEDYKVFAYKDGKRYQPNCDACDGKGIVTEIDCDRILDEWGIDQPTEDFEL